MFEAPTLGCPHCGAGVVLNPLRTRERAHCSQCNAYICDGCHAIMQDPDYVHHTAVEIKEKVGSGQYILLGTMARPVLIKTGGNNG